MHYFNIAIAALSTQKPGLLTSQGLSALLRDVRLWQTLPAKHFSLTEDLLDLLSGVEPHPTNRELLRRIMADPKGWTEDADEATQAGACHYAQMGQFLDPAKMAEVIRYHLIRGNITDLQSQLGIDAIVGTQEVRVLKGSCVVHSVDDQLDPTARDLDLIKQDVPKIAQLFINQVIDSGDYLLLEEPSDEDAELLDVGMGEIYQCSLDAVEASVSSSATDWVFDGTHWTSTSCDRDEILDADEIKLYLQFADGTARLFMAQHKDSSRFPWLE